MCIRDRLSSKDKALIRAQAKAGGGAEYEGMSEEEIYKALGYSAQPVSYTHLHTLDAWDKLR